MMTKICWIRKTLPWSNGFS